MVEVFNGMEIDIDLVRDQLLDVIGQERLKDSYMMTTETSPQQRYAYVSSLFADDQQHAQRLYDYSSKHWLGYATPILSMGRNNNGLPISCLTGDNFINTIGKGFVPIKDIKVGDRVLTHKGHFKQVIAIKRGMSEDLYHLKVKTRSTDIEITGNHLVLTNVGWVRVDELNMSHWVATNGKVVLPEEDYIITNINDHYYDQYIPGTFRPTKLHTNIEIDCDLAWALGFWFAEGSTNKNMVRVTHGSEEQCIQWSTIMSQKFGTNIGTYHHDNYTWYEGHANSCYLQSWFDAEFGVGAKDKIIPEWIVNLPVFLLESFYRGFYEGDGYKTTKEQALGVMNSHIVGSLYLILLKLGKRVSMNLQKKQGYKYSDGITRHYYELRMGIERLTQNRRMSQGILFNDGLIYCPIKYIKKVDKGNQEVFDIQVADDESFSVAGVVVHNCFLVNVTDTRAGLVDSLSETNWLSMLGGGVGVYFGTRGQDEKSVGVIPHMKTYDDCCLAYKQGTTRRGAYAMYLDISHPDIIEFLEMRKETGDQRRKCLNLHYGVNIPDSFMLIIENCMRDENYDDSWELKDPASGKVHEVVSAKDLWAKLIELRAGQGRGEPYIHFIDNSNKTIPGFMKQRGYHVSQSNLCSEILLHTDETNTAVCCLSSLNLDKWDFYKDNYQFFDDVMRMLDNVLQYFIEHAPKKIQRAINSAVNERSVGLGVMGFHSYLQQKNIPFGSVMAKSVNIKIFKTIKEHLDKANKQLGTERGSPSLLRGTGLRFTHMQAIAPTASNALICGNVSASIEPWRANAFRQDTLSGTFIQKNRYLDQIIKKKVMTGECPDYDAVWLRIIQDEGSVQNVDCFDELTKDVFKTAPEIDMMWAVEHVADRQQFIDQGQSFNIFIRPDISIKRLHAIHFAAWKRGVKTMYYVRTEKLVNTEKVSQKVARKRIEDDIDLTAIVEDTECIACEG